MTSQAVKYRTIWSCAFFTVIPIVCLLFLLSLYSLLYKQPCCLVKGERSQWDPGSGKGVDRSFFSVLAEEGYTRYHSTCILWWTGYGIFRARKPHPVIGAWLIPWSELWIGNSTLALEKVACHPQLLLCTWGLVRKTRSQLPLPSLLTCLLHCGGFFQF